MGRIGGGIGGCAIGAIVADGRSESLDDVLLTASREENENSKS